MRAQTIAVVAATVSIILCNWNQALFAGTFNWGDISDPVGDVMYLDIEENNAYATSLFSPEPGTGSPAAVGNAIRFDPQGFAAAASGGGSETTTSTIDMLLMARPGKTVNNLMIRELGDYTLAGLSDGVASASVGATFSWTILEVNNTPVVIPTQVEALQVTAGGGVNGGAFMRPANDGTAVPWDGAVLLDFDAYLMANSIAGSATKVLVEFQNVLEATSDNVSNAFIKKKEIGGFAISANVPEPASLLSLALALAVAGISRRR